MLRCRDAFRGRRTSGCWSRSALPAGILPSRRRSPGTALNDHVAWFVRRRQRALVRRRTVRWLRTPGRQLMRVEAIDRTARRPNQRGPVRALDALNGPVLSVSCDIHWEAARVATIDTFHPPPRTFASPIVAHFRPSPNGSRISGASTVRFGTSCSPRPYSASRS